MERYVQQAFRDQMLNEALSYYQGMREGTKKLTESESFVYEFDSGGRPMILRLTPATHRTYRQIQGEVDFIQYINSNGTAAASPVKSKAGELIHTLKGAEVDFYAVAFENAPGQSATLADWTPDFIQTWGRFVGHMHRRAVDAQKAGIAFHRPHWTEEYNVCRTDVIAGQSSILRQQEHYQCYLESLPQEADGFGVIHSDFETENFFLHHGAITAFDFDECQYHWFVYDIASIVRQASWTVGRLPQPLSLQTFYDHFMAGYRQEYRLTAFWLEQIPKFIQWREICMYVYSHGKQNISAWTPAQKAYFEQVQQRIAGDILPFDIDYGV